MPTAQVTRTRLPVGLAIGLVIAAMGCSALDVPTAAPTDGVVAASEGGPNAAAAQSTHDSLKAIAEQERNRIHQERDRRKAEYQAAKREWDAFRHQLADAKKHKTDLTIDVLRCEPQEYDGDSQLIGPAGGTLHLGKHELKIPKGALDLEVVITGEAPVSELVEVELEPHGLTFARPAALKLNYDNCVVPMNLNLFIVYLSNNGRILDIQPSVDKKGLSTVVGELDHFSRYAVAW